MPNTSQRKIVRKTVPTLHPQKIESLRHSARRVVSTADAPEIQFTGSGESHRIRKRSITLRLDEDVVQFFRSQGPGYQSRINRVLRAAAHPVGTLHDQLKNAAHLLEQLAEQAE